MSSAGVKRVKMEKFLLSLIFISIIYPIFPKHLGNEESSYLHVYKDDNENKPRVMSNTQTDFSEVYQRNRRDLSSELNNDNLRNISTKVNKWSLISELEH